MFQVVGGCFSTSLILTIDLMPLNPYFQGTIKTNRRAVLIRQRLAVPFPGREA